MFKAAILNLSPLLCLPRSFSQVLGPPVRQEQINIKSCKIIYRWDLSIPGYHGPSLNVVKNITQCSKTSFPTFAPPNHAVSELLRARNNFKDSLLVPFHRERFLSHNIIPKCVSIEMLYCIWPPDRAECNGMNYRLKLHMSAGLFYRFLNCCTFFCLVPK